MAELNKDILSTPISITSTERVQRAEDSEVYTFVISDESKDRHGTVILASAWDLENYNKNGIVAYMHDTHDRNNPDKIVGIGTVRIEGGQLLADVAFEPLDLNPLADKIRRKIDFGTLSATSVGFIPKRAHWGVEEAGEDPKVLYFDEVELLEFSIVNIPSNPNAVRRSAELDSYMDYAAKTKNPPADPVPENMNDATRTKLAAAENYNRTIL